ncbi:uncharacterized protein BDZ99DRAFT_193408 [Mytilinidion resinicola]|uniref:Uncharacterized protein n=1 Tax=Mytilinidion resinicola TaxID=574789 RepID=A0A6A6Z518_9PEZI|nr:uncharacterized protein BDZ99DRAFT_193408 [Mytilinidion resinicola]KAF2815275.1 hypothetical protein BDZ99DRAFT_193408 [Mytilinidion resinicola]
MTVQDLDGEIRTRFFAQKILSTTPESTASDNSDNMESWGENLVQVAKRLDRLGAPQMENIRFAAAVVGLATFLMTGWPGAGV